MIRICIMPRERNNVFRSLFKTTSASGKTFSEICSITKNVNQVSSKREFGRVRLTVHYPNLDLFVRYCAIVAIATYNATRLVNIGKPSIFFVMFC
ncbi:hypothetical protein CARUB_v10003103mg [Capsella rubella]|uniref:Uncharacterized protein n=1 Tax=Capsella rubella TaxID=81985 RepID=R0HBQ6_9BRAS|nr:hypothetical protein CARUB_v10003103mg [Capsella rubella]